MLLERGLVDAVRALALDLPAEAEVHSVVPSRLERPLESALYFAVAELLADVARHAPATRVTFHLGYAGRVYRNRLTRSSASASGQCAEGDLSRRQKRREAGVVSVIFWLRHRRYGLPLHRGLWFFADILFWHDRMLTAGLAGSKEYVHAAAVIVWADPDRRNT
ncbi:sensor histidine kinase [Actinoplanes awajinensis]|uniref:hypothetical protein n=1 Tax=Actinoplanes awajinensis TaxID=135946 RepID=UPI000AEB7CAB